MFDTISGKSYRSSGSLPFIAGMTVEQVRDLNLPAGGGELTITAPAEVFSDTLAQEALARAEANGWTIKVADKDSKLPITYDRLEYLEGTGTQYINTGLGASNKTEVREVAKVTPYSGGIYYHRLFGSDTYGDVSRLSLTLTVVENGVQFGSRFGLASRSFDSGLENADLEASAFEYFVSAEKAGVVGKNVQANVLDAEWQCEAQTQLFAWDSHSCAKGRVYSFTLKEAGVLKLNFIPALDPTGAPCMFDVITQTAFYNDGAGADFLYPGSEQQVATYSLRNRMYAKMTEHGLRRLYRVPAGCDLNKDVYAAQNGFKILVDTPKPEEGYWKPMWVEKEYSIELEWVETDPPEEDIQPY